MAILIPNPLPAFQFEGNWAELPMHVMDIESHACMFCGEAPIWDSYADYEAHFWAYEFEGEPNHGPSDEENYNINDALCIGVPDEIPFPEAGDEGPF